jgi:UDP-2,3-diacylglucosamine hydrolase
MSETVFISDLHLDPTRPQIIQLATNWLASLHTDCDGVYILGDLFEYWIGDDQPSQAFESLFKAFTHLAEQNIPLYFVAGNRDFLVGEQFAQAYKINLLPESSVIDLYGKPTLILHGDTLCTDDIKYQQLRSMLRDPDWQKQFLALPLNERIDQALALRAQSAAETDSKDEMIMDVNAKSVTAAMQAAGVTQLIHGHTHRPAIHRLVLDETIGLRIVLGDWYDHGSVLRCSTDGFTLQNLALN